MCLIIQGFKKEYYSHNRLCKSLKTEVLILWLRNPSFNNPELKLPEKPNGCICFLENKK